MVLSQLLAIPTPHPNPYPHPLHPQATATASRAAPDRPPRSSSLSRRLSDENPSGVTTLARLHAMRGGTGSRADLALGLAVGGAGADGAGGAVSPRGVLAASKVNGHWLI